MVTIIRRTLVVGVLLTAHLAYACDFPDPVPIPDGMTATESEMIAADLAIKDYVSEMQGYVDCVKSENRALRNSASTQDISAARLREEQAALYQNKAAAAIEDVAERFNKAVADYKSRNQK